MELILHIGTHKTGTSSLQKFLQINDRVLAENGFYYASRPNAKNSNYLAQLIASKQLKKAQTFLDYNVQRAKRSGAHTVIVSAESFYAMTKFFHQLVGKECSDYWETELELIELLHMSLPRDVQSKVVVVFRRQDRFLESIYGQLVKSRSVALSIDEFRLFMAETLDYQRHLEVWNSVFRDCLACSYEAMSGNINDYFIREILSLENAGRFRSLDLRANERLSRDVLEYKKIINRFETSDIEKRLNKQICSELSNAFPDCGKYSEHLTPDKRISLVTEMSKGNEMLVKRFGIKPFPAVSDDFGQRLACYPGLSARRAVQIAHHHARLKRSVGYQVERLGLVAMKIIRGRTPWLSWFIPIGRSIFRGLMPPGTFVRKELWMK